VMALVLVTGGNGFTGNLNLWADQRWARKLFDSIEQLPKDSLLAGPPMLMDSIPLFAKRKVFVSDEAVQPFYDRYYAEVSSRVYAAYRAYYSADLRTVEDFVEENGVDYMVVQVDDFTHRLHRARYYWEPYNQYVTSLVEGRLPEDFVFARPPQESLVYDDGYFQVVDLPTLLEAGRGAAETTEILHSSIR
jgi:hypothetical protein